MAKIIKAELENFQSHKYSSIEFDKGLTVITGPSDSGKSAIIRAIKWVLYNEPRGYEFISINCSQCRVTLHFDSGVKITRERTATKNRYILEKEGDKEIFEGFGNTVPLEIINSHKIRNLHLDTDQKTSINLATQLEGPFLLSESGAIRAKAIGKILGIHYLDSAARKASTTINEHKREYTFRLEEQKNIKEKLEYYKKYKFMEKKLEKANSNYNQLEQKYFKYQLLCKLAKKLGELEEELTSSKIVLTETANITVLEGNINGMSIYLEKKQKLTDYFLQLHAKNKELNNNKRLVNLTNCHALIQENVNKLDILNKSVNIQGSLLIRFKEKRSQLNHSKTTLKKTLDLDSWQHNLTLIEKQNNKLEQLKKRERMLLDLKKDIISTKYLIHKTNNYGYLCDKITQLNQNLDKLNSLKITSEKIKEKEIRIRKGKEYLKQNSEELAETLRSYREKLAQIEVCPICETEIDKNKTNEIIGKWREESEYRKRD